MRFLEMAWYKEYPHEKTKNDLTGKKLSLIGNKPPENTDKDYLKRVHLKDYDNNQEYTVLLTLRDITNIIEIMPNKFKFVIPDGQEWAEVQKIEEEVKAVE